MSWAETNMKELCGTTISRVRVSGDQRILSFETDRGAITYCAEGDCCSQSWFADIIGVDALIGGLVRDVEEIAMDFYNVKDGRCREEHDEAYGYRITTSKGRVKLAFRNSSNGYYGGWLKLHEGPLEEPMTEITDDWSA